MITVKGTQACKAEFRVQKLWSCDMSDVWRMRDVGGSNWGVCDEGSKKRKRDETSADVHAFYIDGKQNLFFCSSASHIGRDTDQSYGYVFIGGFISYSPSHASKE